MRRGFLNKPKAVVKIHEFESSELAEVVKAATASAAAASNPVKVNVERLAYGKVSDEHKLTEQERKEHMSDAVAYKTFEHQKTNYPEGLFVVACIPPDDRFAGPPNPDGHSIWIVNGPTKAKILNQPGYPAPTPKPRMLGMCELRDAPGMGKGLFATCNIARGELIFSERPLMVIPQGIPPIHFTDIPEGMSKEKAKQLAISRFEQNIEFACRVMREDKIEAFRSLMNCHKEDGSGPLLGVCRTNGFGIGIRDASTGLGYSATGELGSRINHSCIPNVTRKFKKSSFSLQFYAVRDIKAGDELFISYCNIFATKADRQKELAPYGVKCQCAACVNATRETDNLRTMWLSGVAANRHTVTEVFKDLTANQIPSYMLQMLIEMDQNTIKGNMDCNTNYKHVLEAIYLICEKMGKTTQAKLYRRRFDAINRIPDNDDES